MSPQDFVSLSREPDHSVLPMCDDKGDGVWKPCIHKGVPSAGIKKEETLSVSTISCRELKVSVLNVHMIPNTDC